MSADLLGKNTEDAHHHRGYTTVATAVEEAQSRGEAVWGRGTRRNGACGTEGMNTT